MTARQPAFIWGPPGTGKSSVTAQLASSLHHALRALLLDPVDLRGLPYVAQGRSKWAVPEFLPADGAGILFLDELNAAPAMVQAAFYQLVLDRRLGEYTTAGSSWPPAIGTPTGRTPPACPHPCEIALSTSTLRWMRRSGRNGPSAQASGRRSSLSSAFARNCSRSSTATPMPFLLPAPGEFVSRILDRGPEASVEHEMFAGTVGTGAATEFSGFLRMVRELPNIDAILLNPTGEPVTDSPAAQYAVASALAQRASDTNFDRICLYLERMPTEFRVLSVRDAILRDPRIKYTAGYTRWAVHNHHVLA